MKTQNRKTYESLRQIARRETILETTRELLSKHGYEGTTVRDVAAQAGVAKGTLYNIYGGKDGLIFSAVIDVRDDIRDRTIDLEPKGGLDDILKADQAVMERIVDNPAYAEAITRALLGAQGADLLATSLVDVPIELERKSLEAAKELGQIDPETDSRLLAHQLVMQRWGMLMALCLKRLRPEQLHRYATDALVRVLKSVALPEARSQLDSYLRAHA